MREPQEQAQERHEARIIRVLTNREEGKAHSSIPSVIQERKVWGDSPSIPMDDIKADNAMSPVHTTYPQVLSLVWAPSLESGSNPMPFYNNAQHPSLTIHACPHPGKIPSLKCKSVSSCIIWPSSLSAWSKAEFLISPFMPPPFPIFPSTAGAPRNKAWHAVVLTGHIKGTVIWFYVYWPLSLGYSNMEPFSQPQSHSQQGSASRWPAYWIYMAPAQRQSCEPNSLSSWVLTRQIFHFIFTYTFVLKRVSQ